MRLVGCEVLTESASGAGLTQDGPGGRVGVCVAGEVEGT